MVSINKTSNGVLSFCKCCNTYQLEFGNIFISFSDKNFAAFQSYIENIDIDKSTERNKHKPFNRKIMLSFSEKNVFFCLYPEELRELRILIFIDEVYPEYEKYKNFSFPAILAN